MNGVVASVRAHFVGASCSYMYACGGRSSAVAAACCVAEDITRFVRAGLFFVRSLS